MMGTEQDIAALDAVLDFRGKSSSLGKRIAGIERDLTGLSSTELTRACQASGVTTDLLTGALMVKRMSAQIDVILHAVGILCALPHILDPVDRIQSLSLGAGNTGRGFDLETDRQIAEFKFTEWKGGAESVRQDNLLIDVFHLAAAETTKRRVLYLTGTKIPLKFLQSSRRKTREALARRRLEMDRFNDTYGQDYLYVSDYWAAVSSRIDVVDLFAHVPGLAGFDQSD